MSRGLSHGTAAEKSARNLGVDYSSGKARRCSKVRNVRWNQGKAKLRRVKGFLKLTPKAKKRFKTGVVPMWRYAAEVEGTSDGKILEARRAAVAINGCGGRGCQLEAALLLQPEDDPARELMVPPIVRYATEVWFATDGMGSRPKNSTAAECHRMVGDVSQHVHEYCCGKVVSPRGPYSAMFRALAQVGWAMSTPSLLALPATL